MRAKARGARPASRPWYEDAFRGDYLLRYRHRSDPAAASEIAFLRTVLGRKGRRVLDLCCGAGRHSRALKQAGYRIVGLDRSLELLRSAAKRRLRRGIAYARADMRVLPLRANSVDAVVSLFTSFGYFSRETEDRRVLREVARVLKPGGVFVLDFFNRQSTLRKLVPVSEKRIGHWRVREQRRYDRKTKRLEKRTLLLNSRARLLRLESVRAYSPAELAALCRAVGLKLWQRYGDLSGSQFDEPDSPRCVLVLRK